MYVKQQQLATFNANGNITSKTKQNRNCKCIRHGIFLLNFMVANKEKKENTLLKHTTPIHLA